MKTAILVPPRVKTDFAEKNRFLHLLGEAGFDADNSAWFILPKADMSADFKHKFTANMQKREDFAKYTGVLGFGGASTVCLGLSTTPSGVGQFRGRKLAFCDRPLVIVGDPYAVFSSPSKLGEIKAELAFAKRVLSGEQKECADHVIFDIERPEDVANLLDAAQKSKVCAYDIETTSLDVRDIWLVSMGFCPGNLGKVGVEVEGASAQDYAVWFWAGYDKLKARFESHVMEQFCEAFADFFSCKKFALAGHNSIRFDDWCLETCFSVPVKSTFDTMLMKWAVDTQRPHGLKDCVARRLGFPKYDAEFDAAAKALRDRRSKAGITEEDVYVLTAHGHKPDVVPSRKGEVLKWPAHVDKLLGAYAMADYDVLRKYNSLDAVYTYMLWESYAEEIKRLDLVESERLRTKIAHEFKLAEQHGMLLDKDLNRQWSAQLDEILTTVTEKMDAALNAHFQPQHKLEDFNPNSPDDVAMVLFGHVKQLPVLDRKKLEPLFYDDLQRMHEMCDAIEFEAYGGADGMPCSFTRNLLKDDEFDEQGAVEYLQEKFLDAYGDLAQPPECTTRPIGTGGFGYDPVTLTATGKPSCSKAALRTLMEVKPSDFLALLIMHRKASKIKKNFVDSIYETLDEDDRVRGSFNPVGTVTGRVSSTKSARGGGGNLQNWVKALRGQIIAPPGKVICGFDVVQAEVYTLAAFSQDENLLNALKSEDMHRTIAGAIFNKEPQDVTDDERQIGKTTVFLTIYQGGAKTLALALGLPIPRAQEIIDTFLSRFPAAAAWLLKQKRVAAQAPYFVQTAFGTRISTADVLSSDWGTKAHTERLACNAPIQGTAGEMTLWYMVKICEEMRARGWDAQLLNTVHDSAAFEVAEHLAWSEPTDKLDKSGNPIMKAAGPFPDLIRETFSVPVPFPPLEETKFKCDIYVSKHWDGKPDLEKALSGKSAIEKFRWDLLKPEEEEEEVGAVCP